MKQDKKEKRNNILYSVLGFVLGIAMCGIGIYGMILNRIESQEYKNTTDKREVIAVVESCREIDNSDDKDKNKKNSRSVKYRPNWHLRLMEKLMKEKKPIIRKYTLVIKLRSRFIGLQKEFINSAHITIW